MIKTNKVAFVEPFPTPASPISIRDQNYTKSKAKANIFNLLSNLDSKNRFIYKPADNKIALFRSPKNVRRLSLQIHQNFQTQEDAESKIADKFAAPPNFASFFNTNSSPYTDRDDASRGNSSFFMDKSDCTSTTKNRFFEPKKLHHHVRRKSCYCSCCGGLSHKEKKTWHLNLKSERVARMDDILSPSRQISHQNPFLNMSPASRETTRNSNRSGQRSSRRTVIDLRSSSPIKPKTAFGRRESLIARPASPDFNINIETRTRNKTYTYERRSLIPGVIEESNQCALEKSADVSMDSVDSSAQEGPKVEDLSPNKKSNQKVENNNKNSYKIKKQRGSSIDLNLEASPRLEAKKPRVKLTKLKNSAAKKSSDKAVKLLRSNSQMLLVQDYLGKSALPDRKAAPVKRIVHQNSLSIQKFSITNLEPGSLSEAAAKEIEELKSLGILQSVEKDPSLTSLMDFSLRKLPKEIPEKENEDTRGEEESEPLLQPQKTSPKNRVKKRAMSLPKLLLKATGSQKKLQEVSKVYKSGREENDKRYGSVKIRLERLKHSGTDRTIPLPGDITNRTSVVGSQRECVEIKGADSAYQRILKSLRSSLVEVTKDQKLGLEKKKSSEKANMERSQSIGYFPVHLFSKRKDIGGYSGHGGY